MTDPIKDELAAALVPLWVDDVDPEEGPIRRQRSRGELAAALLPVVQRIADRRAAEALREAAEHLADTYYAGKPLLNGHGTRRLRARADALAAAAGTPTEGQR